MDSLSFIVVVERICVENIRSRDYGCLKCIYVVMLLISRDKLMRV